MHRSAVHSASVTMTPEHGLSAAVAAEIRAEIARQGVSRRRLSLDLGFAPSYLDRRLKGATPFRLDELESVARRLDVSVPTLLSRADDYRQRAQARPSDYKSSLRAAAPRRLHLLRSGSGSRADDIEAWTGERSRRRVLAC